MNRLPSSSAGGGHTVQELAGPGHSCSEQGLTYLACSPAKILQLRGHIHWKLHSELVGIVGLRELMARRMAGQEIANIDDQV